MPFRGKSEHHGGKHEFRPFLTGQDFVRDVVIGYTGDDDEDPPQAM